MALLLLVLFSALIVYGLRHGSSQQPAARPPERRQRSAQETRPRRSTGPEITVTFSYGSGGARSSARINARLSADTVWVSPGRKVTVQDFTLSDGMVYVGTGLAAAGSRWSVEPALIDPELPVDRSRPDREGRYLGYYPAYDDLRPASRAAFLAWLAEGRCRPDIPIGYVFLFFYGLERRFLEDRGSFAAARQETPLILAEVERLLGLYGDHDSFAGYAGRFLAYARAVLDQGVVGAEPNVTLEDIVSRGSDWRFDAHLRLSLGRLVHAGEPIPARLALAWYRRAGNVLRTPAQRCADLFAPLFEHFYQEAFDGGLRLKPNKTNLELSYNAASPGLGYYTHTTDLPDVTRLTAPLGKIGDLVDRATDELDSYSRWLGRNADDDNHLPGLALVPRQVFDRVQDPRLDDLRDWLQGVCDDGGPATVSAAELIDRWPTSKPDRLLKRDGAGLAQLLDRLGYGIEPDVRFGGPNLKADQQAVLFLLGDGAPEAPSREYAAASMLLHLSAVVAAADGTVSQEEERYLEQHLEEVLRLDPGERQRLRMHLHWLLTEQPGLAGMKRRLKKLNDERRRAVGTFAVSVAGADGHIDPDEVKVLTKVYELLELDPNALYSDVHALEAGDAASLDAPRTVVPGRPRPGGYRVPPPGEVPEGGLRLDMDKVRQTRQESAETASILTEIFREDETEEAAFPTAGSGTVKSSAAEMATADTPSPIAFLDSPHSALLRSLADTTAVPRGDFDARAEKLGLFPAGALDLLNDAAFEICDEPVLEGDDPLEVNRYAMEEMTA